MAHHETAQRNEIDVAAGRRGEKKGGLKGGKSLYRNKNSIKGYNKLQHYNLISEKAGLANC